MKVTRIALEVGIYSSQATITRHRTGRVTIRNPFIKWTDGTGTLAFERIRLNGAAAKEASEDIFSDDPTMSYGAFLYDQTQPAH